jgi:glutaminase
MEATTTQTIPARRANGSARPSLPAAVPSIPSVRTRAPAPVTTFLERLHARHRDTFDGEVATYIPALAAADPAWFGLAMMTVDGTGYAVGDSARPFTIQSISKPFTYGLVLDDLGEEAVRRRIGVEPTGDAFNAITLAPGSGTPLNPMVNAGAIAAASLVADTADAVALERIVALYAAAAGRPLRIDHEVFVSERETGHRNRAIGHLLRASGVLGDVPDAALERYFAQCSVEVDAMALAAMAATLANGGVNPRTGARVLSAATARAVLSVMATCGMYDSAGDWLYTVGLPAKSGVSGGILAVVPGQLGIGLFSPLLDARGNSVRGVAACRELAHELDLHLVGRGPAAAPPLRARHSVARLASKRTRSAAERETLSNAGWQAEVRELQGDLTFLAVEAAIRGLEDESVGPRFVVLDLGRVVRVEPAANGLLADLICSLRDFGRDVVVCGWSAHGPAVDALDERLVAHGHVAVRRFADADYAREWCEDVILAQVVPPDAEPSGVDAADASSLSELVRGFSPADADAVRSRLERRRFAPGAVIVRRGDPARELFLIVRGRASVMVDRAGGGGPRRLTTLTDGTIFGELAFVTDEPRSADVLADTMVDCQVLCADDFDALLVEQPRAAAAVLANLLRVVGSTARRLTDEVALLTD